jgi:hypothetical protein
MFILLLLFDDGVSYNIRKSLIYIPFASSFLFLMDIFLFIGDNLLFFLLDWSIDTIN